MEPLCSDLKRVKFLDTEILIPPIDADFCAVAETRGLSLPKLKHKSVFIEQRSKQRLGNFEKRGKTVGIVDQTLADLVSGALDRTEKVRLIGANPNHKFQLEKNGRT